MATFLCMFVANKRIVNKAHCASDGAADEYGCEWRIDVGDYSDRNRRKSSNCKKEDVRNAKRGLYMPSFDIIFFTGLFTFKSAKLKMSLSSGPIRENERERIKLGGRRMSHIHISLGGHHFNYFVVTKRSFIFFPFLSFHCFKAMKEKERK
jgi:hypothetical protein